MADFNLMFSSDDIDFSKFEKKDLEQKAEERKKQLQA